MSLLVYGAVLFLLSSPLVVLSNIVLNRVEVVRHAGSLPSADAFSNTACNPSYCPLVQGAHCYKPDCCKCQCPGIKANYIVNEWDCVSRTTLNQMNSTKCKYSIRKSGEPLLALPLTEIMVQKVSFTNTRDHRTLIPCNESIQISWEYRDVFGKWKNGEGNIFNVEVEIAPHPTVPRILDQRVVTALEWSGQLRSDYAGLLIRFLFKCKGNVQGCALAKISGKHTYDITRFSTARPPSTTENLPTTTENPPTTTENPPTTTENPPTTTENPPTTTEKPPTTTENPPTTTENSPTTTENPPTTTEKTPTTTENPPTTTEKTPTTTENSPTTTENPTTTTENPPTTTETTSTASLLTSRSNPTALMMIIVNVIIVIGRHLITSQP